MRDARENAPKPSSPRTLSVITVVLNEAAHLERLKRSLDGLDVPAGVRVETVLVDGGSSDGGPAAARSLGFTQVIELPGANIPVSRNAGARAASGEWLAFVDADCEVAPDWLRQAMVFLEGEERLVIGWPASPPEPATWVQRAWFAHWSFKNHHRETFRGCAVVRKEAFRLLTTRNMLMHRAVFDRLGGFDENLPTSEDSDFVFRASRRGLVVLGVPALRVVHHGEPATLRAFYRQQAWHANRSSYARIVGERSGKTGGHAPLFTVLYVFSLAAAAAGVALSVVTAWWYWLFLIVPFAALLAGPAALIARRAKSWRLVPALSVLYAAYGCARALDLVGFYRTKRSWKTAC